MKKIVFTIIFIIGIITISIMAFVIPQNPYQIVPSLCTITSDKPLWLDIIIVGWSSYLMLLYSIYNYFEIGGD